jgi:hypothetical protein
MDTSHEYLRAVLHESRTRTSVNTYQREIFRTEIVEKYERHISCWVHVFATIKRTEKKASDVLPYAKISYIVILYTLHYGLLYTEVNVYVCNKYLLDQS